jgi:hypothetical protein
MPVVQASAVGAAAGALSQTAISAGFSGSVLDQSI